MGIDPKQRHAQFADTECNCGVGDGLRVPVLMPQRRSA